MTDSSLGFEKIGPTDGITTVLLHTPEVCSNNAAEVLDGIMALVDGDEDISLDVDCRNVTFVDALGLSVFVQLSRVSNGFRLVNQAEAIQRPLQLTGLAELLPNVVTIEES